VTEQHDRAANDPDLVDTTDPGAKTQPAEGGRDEVDETLEGAPEGGAGATDAPDAPDEV
jgi:hypothetical protein